jgi:hypothetical protein
MAIIGQGVQAGLGRIDYSPYLQGAAAGAQGIAQGVAQFGQSVSIGIQNYLKKEQDKKLTAEGVAFIKSQFPGIDDKAAEAGLKFYGGPAAYAKVRNDQMVFEMQKKESELRLGELQRTIAERNKLEQFLTQTPAEAAIGAGTSFEKLPTGTAAFLPRQFGNAQELLQAGQRAGIPVSQLLPVATGMASLGKTEAEARALGLKTASGKKVYNSFEAAANELNRMQANGLLQKGQVGNVKSEGDGYVIETSSMQVPDPEATARVDLIKGALNQDMEAGRTARNLAPGINDLNKLFQEGLTTDRLTPFKTRAMSLAKGLGFTVDEKKLEQLETAEAYMTQQILGFIQQTKGAVSNKENDLFALMGPGIQRSTATNRRLLKIMDDRLRLEAQIGDLVRTGLDKGLPFEVIGKRRQELIDKYDKSLPSIEDLGIQPAAQAAAVPAPPAMAFPSKDEIAAEKKRRGIK